jgi:hypothetical protein
LYFLLQYFIDTVDKGAGFLCGNIDETNGFWGHRQNDLKSLPISIAFFFFPSSSTKLAGDIIEVSADETNGGIDIGIAFVLSQFVFTKLTGDSVDVSLHDSGTTPN